MRGFAVALLVSTAVLAHGTSAEEPVRASVAGEQIPYFDRGSEGARFGSFEFLGGVELSSPEARFGAWSSVRFLPDGVHFIGVLDTGHWLRGAIKRDTEGRLSGIEDVSIASMRDIDGSYNQNKWSVDAESLAVRGDEVFVGYEQRHRVTAFSPLSEVETARPSRMALPLPFPVRQLRGNGGLETLAAAPMSSPLKGSLVAVSEKSFDENGNLIAGILDGPLEGEFRVVSRDGFDVTDGVFLPDGDLLLLKRRFTLATGVGMRVLRIKGNTLKPGAVVDGAVVLEANLSYQIDNMEGIDAVAAADGSIHIFLVSDDNHSMLQRTLLLEFRLLQ